MTALSLEPERAPHSAWGHKPRTSTIPRSATPTSTGPVTLACWGLGEPSATALLATRKRRSQSLSPGRPGGSALAQPAGRGVKEALPGLVVSPRWMHTDPTDVLVAHTPLWGGLPGKEAGRAGARYELPRAGEWRDVGSDKAMRGTACSSSSKDGWKRAWRSQDRRALHRARSLAPRRASRRMSVLSDQPRMCSVVAVREVEGARAPALGFSVDRRAASRGHVWSDRRADPATHRRSPAPTTSPPWP